VYRDRVPLFAALIDEIGPVRSTFITYINPAVAAVVGVLVLNETLTVPMIVGFVLVVAGSALATRRRTPAAQEGPESLEVIGA
jgi:drug/metabolite transporter (DMT)-like permease